MFCVGKHPPPLTLSLHELHASPGTSCTRTLACVVQRAELPKEGLIPVTAESFAKWKADRAAKRIADWEAKRAEEAKRTGGRGLSTCPLCALLPFPLPRDIPLPILLRG